MDEFSSEDYRYMADALRLAKRGTFTARPNPAVGCILVSPDQQVVGQGWHERAGEPHAEVNAINQAGDLARGATAYVTLEPCGHHGRTPPCTDKLVNAGVSRVVYAVEDPNPAVAGQGASQLKAAGIEVQSGLLADAATELNRGFFTRMQLQRPWVRSKLAVSLDGRTALASGESQWITGPEARLDVHRGRAGSGAVVTGIGTVLQDDPALNARVESENECLQPLRVVLDSGLKIPPQAKLFREDGPVMVMHCRGSDSAIAALESAGATVVSVAATDGQINLQSALELLAENYINDVWVEAGPGLNGALLEAGLIDELIVYQAASVLGSDARGMFELSPLENMSKRLEFDLIDARRVGNDLRLKYKPGKI